MPDFSLEIACRAKGHAVIAGVDEAGRGPLAGPVAAAAVILPEGFELEGLNDSKKLTAARRERMEQVLTTHPGVRWSLAFAEAEEIDRINILRATHAAMARAVAGLEVAVDFCLVDGLPVRDFAYAHEGVVKGDGISWSIAAASVIAKVGRDRRMIEAAEEFPAYGFERHKGYGTRRTSKHFAAMGLVAFIVGRFSPLLNGCCRLRTPDGDRLESAEIGRLGERIARHWLWAHGAKVLYRNFRAPNGGEVDVVARDGRLLLFTEVKTRTSLAHGRPLEAVNEKKRRLIRRGANAWLRQLGTREIPWRFDVIEIVLVDGERPRVHRVENAFGSSSSRSVQLG